MIRLSDPLPDPYDELRDVAEFLLAANRRQAVELKAKTVEIEALKFELARLKRWRFGASAERARRSPRSPCRERRHAAVPGASFCRPICRGSNIATNGSPAPAGPAARH